MPQSPGGRGVSFSTLRGWGGVGIPPTLAYGNESFLLQIPCCRSLNKVCSCFQNVFILMKKEKKRLLLLGKYKYYMNAQMELKMPPKCWEKNLQFTTEQTTCDQLSSERSSSKTSLISPEKNISKMITSCVLIKKCLQMFR